MSHLGARAACPEAAAIVHAYDESSALQPLGKQTQTIAIPPQKFYDIASAPAK